jgi:lipoprotein-anchoring transpeptidase ErfK/SrfK
MGSSFRALLVSAAALCLALPASTAAAVFAGFRPAAVVGASWVAPTPGEGARFTVEVGKTVTINLAATAPGAPVTAVSIQGAGLPAGSSFQRRDGNPASASFQWKPRRSAARKTVTLTFTAQPTTPGLAAVRRHVRVTVTPKPKPERFVLSSERRHLYRYAFVLRAGVARSAPRKTAAAVGQLGRWTPEGTTNLVVTLDGRRTRRGVWIHVRLATLPNGRTGWVPRRMLSDWKEVRTRLVVDRRRLTATLYRRGRVVFRAPVGVGQPHWPTPRGEFFIRNQLYGFGNPVYGPIAFGTSARSAVLTDWPGGGYIGLHGTNQPQILPGRVSHGCIRMKNGHILRLARLMPVGTPLTVT